jgi:hypothetical protein
MKEFTPGDYPGVLCRRDVRRLCRLQSLINIPQNIFNIFQPDAQADEFGADAGGALLLLI